MNPDALRSLNRGLPVTLRYPRSPASQAIRHLAKTLISLSAPEPVEVAVKAKAGKPAKQPKPASKRAASGQGRCA